MKKITENLLAEYDDEENDDTPEIYAGAKLVPYSPTTEVTKAIEDFNEMVREAITVSPADWPKGRTLDFEVEFVVVPKTIKAKFGQK